MRQICEMPSNRATLLMLEQIGRIDQRGAALPSIMVKSAPLSSTEPLRQTQSGSFRLGSSQSAQRKAKLSAQAQHK
jgi:hypothetical protein